VAMLLPSLKNVGPVRVALEIIRNLSHKANVQFTIFYVRDQIELLAPCPAKKLNLSTIWELKEHDIVHSHMLRPDVVSAFLLGGKIKKLSTIHNFVKEDLYFLYGRLVSRLVTPVWIMLWSKMHVVAVLSEAAKSYYSSLGLGNDSIRVIRNGISLSSAAPEVDPCDEDLFKGIRRRGLKVVGSVCLFNERKGLDQVVRMLTMKSDVAYVVVGDGPAKERLIDLARLLGVEDRLYILGFRHNASGYFRLFDVYAMPSRAEGAPLALLEAIANGVAVVCSDINVFKESFDEKEVTFFQLEDVASLAKAIDKALLDKSKPNAAYLKFLAHYTSEVMASNYFALYTQLLNRV
jgi:glycosyltransferase involved in cell wall biosynthesis